MEHAYIGPVVDLEASLHCAQGIIYVLASTPDSVSSDPQGFVELPYRFYNASAQEDGDGSYPLPHVSLC